MKPVTVYDNFLNGEDLDDVIKYMENVKWEFKGKTSSKSKRFWYVNLKDEQLFTEKIYILIQKKTTIQFELVRVMLNGQTFGQDGDYHTDENDPAFFTFLLYISDINRENVDKIGGYTQFKLENYIMNIEPIFNRGVLFKSNIVHRGLAPSRDSDILRISVAFKLKISDVAI